MDSTETLRRTPLFECHKACGAKFVPFGGWEMPVQYTGLIDEHQTVRSQAGLFDVSHMGEILVEGPRALEFLQHVTSNDVSKLVPGKAQYSLLPNEKGGVVDDIIIYFRGPERYLLCVNASNTDKDFRWLIEHNTFGVSLDNVSADYCQIAVQGPKAWEILGSLTFAPLTAFAVEQFPMFTFQELDWKQNNQTFPVIVARTGYTGEDGFEIFCPVAAGAPLWQALLETGRPFGVKPCGLGARDTLRLEACYPLHGHELSDDLSALACGVGWVVKLDKGPFIGRDALAAAKQSGVPQKLVGLEVEGRGIVREQAKLFKRGTETEVGWSSSGTMTPTVGKAVALGFVAPEHAALGAELEADVRGKRLPVKVIKTPFYKRPAK